MLNTLMAQVLENLIKCHHFNLITVRNLDTCYLKAAKRLDLIGFDNSTCWYFSFKLHITISILHSSATSFSCFFLFWRVLILQLLKSQVPLPLLLFHYYWFPRSKHHIIMHELISRFQIVAFPVVGCKTLSVHWENTIICMTINPIFWHELGLIYMHLWWSDDVPTWQGRCLKIPFVVQGFWSAQSHLDDDCHQNPWGFQCGEKPSQCKIDWNPLANILAMYDDGDTPSKFSMEFPFLNDSKRCKLQLLQLIVVFGAGRMWSLQCMMCPAPGWCSIEFQAPIFAHKLPTAVFIYTDVSFPKNAKLAILFQINRYLLGVVW